ncbi:RIKEN cDNA 1700029M20, isoform CRA_b [Mus musculus]|nr:RIKEN cDNA 1700029M20, isoform CRA_b [Mus musculus]
MAPGTAASEERQEHTLRERKTVVSGPSQTLR